MGPVCYIARVGRSQEAGLLSMVPVLWIHPGSQIKVGSILVDFPEVPQNLVIPGLVAVGDQLGTEVLNCC